MMKFLLLLLLLFQATAYADDTDRSAEYILNRVFDSTTNALNTSGGSASVSGDNGQVQFNCNDALCGDSGMSYNSDTNILTATGGFTAGTTDNPTISFDVATSGDTDFWIGARSDGAGTDNDSFQMGNGLIPGTNTIVTLQNSRVGIGDTTPDVALDVETSSNSLARLTSTANGEGLFIQGISDTISLVAVTGDSVSLRANNSSTDSLTIASGGNITITDGFSSSSTGSLGWSIVTGANTVCTTTCTSAAVMGQDTDDANKPIVGPSDASADRCLCAGSS